MRYSNYLDIELQLINVSTEPQDNFQTASKADQRNKKAP
jgi:hypothetical protein